MIRSSSLAAYLRAHARRCLDRVEPDDEGRNARCALTLLDAAAYAATLADDDPLLLVLDRAGCYGPSGRGGFDPGPVGERLICSWQGGEPRDLLLTLPAAMAMAGEEPAGEEPAGEPAEEYGGAPSGAP